MVGFYALMAVLVLALLFVLGTRRMRLEWVFKPLAALTFVSAAAYQGAFDSAYGMVLFAGLVLAAIGDVLLIPKKTFLFGLISFLLGHVAYGVAFVVRGIDVRATLVAFAICLVGSLAILRWLLPHVERPMRAPVLAYVAVITSMVGLAVGTYSAAGDALVVLGAVGFFFSDLAVARDRFVKTEFKNRLWGLPLYFFAQLILASTAGGAS